MAALTVNRAEAKRQLEDRIAKGDELLSAAEEVRTQEEFHDFRDRYYTWDEYNTELLRKLFTAPDESETYSQWIGIAFPRDSLAEELREKMDDVRSKNRRLQSVIERLELFDDPADQPEAATSANAEDSQEAIARRLLETLEAIKASGYADEDLKQQAKTLNARLAPTYHSIYGATPLIITTYPARVWFPRAWEQVQQALAIASSGAPPPPPAPPESPPSRRVFVVHGRDHGLKEAVARLVERIGYQAIVLAEEPDQGQTIIEKFERAAVDAAFAVVLLSPDDEGRLRSDDGAARDLAPRARQNVVWEYGYFAALLGRGAVAALVMDADKLERPSDLDGLLYITVPSIADDGWRMKLARRMKEAGLTVDMNQV